MSEDIMLDVVRKTQVALSKFIKKPPLTEKLLRKPPFRFLHDIVTSVMRETGFLEGLFTAEEMNSENIKDKDGKILFLEKLIAAVKIASGVNLTARPNKIVAGLDVTKTNEFLQAIGVALEKKVDSKKAVEQVLNKGKTKPTGDDVKHTKEVKNKVSKENNKKEEKVKSRNSVPKENVNKEGKKRRIKTDSATKPKQNLEEETTKKESDVKQIKPKIESTYSTIVEKTQAPEEDVTQEVNVLKNEETTTFVKDNSVDVIEKPQQDIVASEITDTNSFATIADTNVIEKVNDVTENETKRPQSARPSHRKKSSRKKIEPDQEKDVEVPKVSKQNKEDMVTRSTKPLEEETAFSNDKTNAQILGGVLVEQNVGKETPVPKRPRTATARPASARPGAPRVRDRGEIVITEEVRAPIGPVNLIVDTDDTTKEDDDNLLVVETVGENVRKEILDTTEKEGEAQGHLVAQILETQKELEDTSLPVAESSHKTDIDWKGGRQREHDAVVNEVEKLRNSIQAITRTANPLGKLIDFLQEDVDSMQSELESWRTSNSQLKMQLQAEQKLTEKTVEPLQHQLNNVEMLIQEMLGEISLTKATILRNDERIHKLLSG